MNILGLSAGHDASLAIVRSGSPRLLLEKERATRRKHATGAMGGLIESALRAADLSLTDIDHVALVDPIWPERGQDWEIIEGALPTQLDQVVSATVSICGLHMPASIVPHHLAHAAYALLSSKHRDGSVLTMDGGGGLTDASFSSWVNGAPTRVVGLDRMHLGSLWSVAARSLFGDIFGAGKVMGLAAFGVPSFERDFRKQHGDPDSDPSSVRSAWSAPGPLLQSLEGLPWRSERARNAAASLQAYSESVVRALLKQLAGPGELSLLAMGGGLALNGYLTSMIASIVGSDRTWFPPAVHDGGLSLGAALFAAERNGERTSGADTAFLGLDPDGLLRAHDSADNSFWDQIAGRLAAGQVVGLCVGRAEVGPRALGHRSIVASPAHPWMRDYLNSHVKSRESFRPIAPVFLEEHEHQFMRRDGSVNRFMTMIGEVSALGKDVLGPFVHADGTVRGQLVRTSDTLGALVGAMERGGHAPVVLNTSLNQRGEPLCQSRADAIRAMGRLSLDCLVVQAGAGLELIS